MSTVSPSLGLGLGAAGAALPRLADGFVNRAQGFQDSLKRKHDSLERDRAPSGPAVNYH